MMCSFDRDPVESRLQKMQYIASIVPPPRSIEHHQRHGLEKKERLRGAHARRSSADRAVTRIDWAFQIRNDKSASRKLSVVRCRITDPIAAFANGFFRKSNPFQRNLTL